MSQKQKVQVPFKIFVISASQLPVELDEHQVPDLQDVGVVHVHQVGGVPPSDAVVVDLAAGAAGAGVSHLPEVVLHAAGQDASLVHAERKHSKQRERGQIKSNLLKCTKVVGNNVQSAPFCASIISLSDIL